MKANSRGKEEIKYQQKEANPNPSHVTQSSTAEHSLLETKIWRETTGWSLGKSGDRRSDRRINKREETGEIDWPPNIHTNITITENKDKSQPYEERIDRGNWEKIDKIKARAGESGLVHGKERPSCIFPALQGFVRGDSTYDWTGVKLAAGMALAKRSSRPKTNCLWGCSPGLVSSWANEVVQR